MPKEEYFIKKVKKFVDDNNLLDKSSLHIIALSGGADSTALLLALHQMGYKLEAAHCNFRLRGEESNRDEAFCSNLCSKLSIPLHRIHFDTREYANLHKISIEMAARNLRYHYFEQLRQDLNANDILVAHHKEDNVETVLINLVRGTGLHGLCGIQPRNGHIKRPLLGIHREEIEEFLKTKGQSYVTDSTNLIDDVTRNKIRLNILPLLKDINPSVIDNIDSTSNHITEGAKIVDDSLDRFLNNKKEIVCYLPNPGHEHESLETGAEINIDTIRKYSSPEYALYYILQKYNFTGVQAEQIFANLNKESGKSWKSTSHELITDRGRIIIETIHEADDKNLMIPETGTYRYDESNKFGISLKSASEFEIIKSNDTACLDFDKVKFPLHIRHIEKGDRFIPFGMTGSKLISDFLTDRKKNIFEKKSQLVVTDCEGNIIWLAGLRPDNRYRIEESTKKILVLCVLS